jgi:molybdenum cofactor cytidylyltransferase
MIWAVILAAGESRRMREPKLLLPYGEATVIESVVRNVARSHVDRILVVLGSGWEKIEEKVKKFSVGLTVNPHFSRGMLSSVQWGFQKLPRQAKAALVFLGDQPGIASETINAVIRSYKKSHKGLVLPIFRGRPGHPLLIAMKYRREVGELDSEIGLRHLLALHPDDLEKVEVADPGILRDIDDWQDYRKELRLKGRAAGRRAKAD